MTDPEKAVRDAAEKLHAAIETATAAGYAIDWPSRARDLPAIGINETGGVKVAVTVNAAADIDPATAMKAADAAQKAADRVVDKAKG